jgi:hypothetical protein
MPRIEIRGYETKHPSGVMCRVKNKDTFFLRKMEIINVFYPDPEGKRFIIVMQDY